MVLLISCESGGRCRNLMLKRSPGSASRRQPELKAPSGLATALRTFATAYSSAQKALQSCGSILTRQLKAGVTAERVQRCAAESSHWSGGRSTAPRKAPSPTSPVGASEVRPARRLAPSSSLRRLARYAAFPLTPRRVWGGGTPIGRLATRGSAGRAQQAWRERRRSGTP